MIKKFNDYVINEKVDLFENYCPECETPLKYSKILGVWECDECEWSGQIDDKTSIDKPRGYINSFDRDACWKCEFYYNNSGKVAKQEVKIVCTKVSPPFEIMDDDVCDEYKEK